jgi:hypothetical protein
VDLDLYVRPDESLGTVRPPQPGVVDPSLAACVSMSNPKEESLKMGGEEGDS